jgi:hypothetical protein
MHCYFQCFTGQTLYSPDISSGWLQRLTSRKSEVPLTVCDQYIVFPSIFPFLKSIPDFFLNSVHLITKWVRFPFDTVGRTSFRKGLRQIAAIGVSEAIVVEVEQGPRYA